VDRPLAVVNAVNTASPATWWVSVDHLNRPVKMTNSAKAAVWTAVWQPWGAAQSITGSATLNARFPGQWFQVEAGLHYNWHRHYDPSLGRYTQPDPLEFVDGPSVYGYVRGNPLEFVDPEGLAILGPQSKRPSRSSVEQCGLKDKCLEAVKNLKGKGKIIALGICMAILGEDGPTPPPPPTREPPKIDRPIPKPKSPPDGSPPPPSG